MRRVALALFLSSLFAVTLQSVPAKAGGFYDDDYRPRYSRYYEDDYRPYRPYRRSYSSDCCYSRVSYYRRAYDRSYDRSYYDRPYYRSSYYDRPSYRSSYYDRPYRSYWGDRYSRYSRYDDDGWSYGRPYITHYSTYTLPPYYRDSYDYDYRPRYSSWYGGGYGYRSYSRPYYSSYYSDYGYRNYSGYSSWNGSWNRGYDPYTRAAYPYDQPRRYYPEGCRRSKIYDDAGGYVWGNGLSCGH